MTFSPRELAFDGGAGAGSSIFFFRLSLIFFMFFRPDNDGVVCFHS